MLERLRDKKEEKLEVKWDEVEKQMEDMLNLIKTYKPSSTSTDVILKSGESQYYRLQGVGLIEPRRAPIHRAGAYGGPTVHMGKVPIHMGAFYATQTKPMPDILATVDSGTVVITTTRIIFKGNRYSKTLQLTKLVDYDNDPISKTVTFFAENSTKSIGISYGDAKLFTTYIEMAISDMNHNRDKLISQWENNIEEHQASKPHIISKTAPPISGDGNFPLDRQPYLVHDINNLDGIKTDQVQTPPNASQPIAAEQLQPRTPPIPTFPPAWYVDPYKQAQFRWWNGAAWTSYTS